MDDVVEEERRAAEIESDEEVFEINDFTNATPWESFIADIEKIIRQWGLSVLDNHEDFVVGRQHRKTERVSYSGRQFVVSLEVCRSTSGSRPTEGRGSTSDDDVKKVWPHAMWEMMETCGDFPPRTHHLSRWYGLGEFVLIAPDEGVESLTSQAQAKLMLSSISVALANTGCSTPVFVQVHTRWRQMYVGVCEGRGVRVNFDMVQLRYTPQSFSHLSGLLEQFKSKVKCPLSRPEPIQLAIRYTYVLRDWNPEEWPVEPLDDFEHDDITYLKTIPIGATSDPIKEIHLSAMWPNMTEEMIVDRESHSDLKPSNAPIWTVIACLVDNPSCLLSENLLNFLKLCYHFESMVQLVGQRHADDSQLGYGSEQTFSQALERLTEPKAASALGSPLVSSVLYSSMEGVASATSGSGSGQFETEVLSGSLLDEIMKIIFPDSADNKSMKSPLTSPPVSGDNDLTWKLKSAPVNSLTHFMSTVLCNIKDMHGMKAFALVWQEIVKEFRYRWDTGTPICGVPDDSPDMRCCLLHQKLQMLNCCIKHKLSHQQKLKTPNIKSHSSGDSLSHSHSSPSSSYSEFHTPSSSMRRKRPSREMEEDKASSSEDEFYEALEDVPQQVELEHETSEMELSESDNQLKLLAAEDCTNNERGDDGLPRGDSFADRHGALEQFGDLVLVNTGQPLCIPVTQEHTPMTEDMLWEQATVLSNLGTSEEAARVRAKMQSSSLVSDMQAFKAANPGCLLEDFVRWYSPRDWIEEEMDSAECLKSGGTTTETEGGEKDSSCKEKDNETSTEGKDGGDVSGESTVVMEIGEAAELSSEADGVGEDRDGSEACEAGGDGETGGHGETGDGGEGVEVGDGWDNEGWGEDDWDVVNDDIEVDKSDQPLSNEQEDKPEVPTFKYVKGNLSQRMCQPNNIWVESWISATPIPAYKQKRLFDDTKEAEKVLHYLNSLKVCDLALLLLPTILHSALNVLNKRQREQPLATVESYIQDAASLLATITQPSLDILPKYQESITLLSQAERLLAAAHSLKSKLAQGLELNGESVAGVGPGEGGKTRRRGKGELDVSTEVLLEGPELVLKDPTNSLTGRALSGMLAAQVALQDLDQLEIEPTKKNRTINTSTVPEASGKEFILRTVVPRPAPYSVVTPQRMFAVLTREQFRLAGAFSADTNLV